LSTPKYSNSSHKFENFGTNSSNSATWDFFLPGQDLKTNEIYPALVHAGFDMKTSDCHKVAFFLKAHFTLSFFLASIPNINKRFFAMCSQVNLWRPNFFFSISTQFKQLYLSTSLKIAIY
jgi:phage-related protein